MSSPAGQDETLKALVHYLITQNLPLWVEYVESLAARLAEVESQLAQSDAVIVGHWQSAGHAYPDYRIEDQARPVREAHERHAARASRAGMGERT